MTLRLARILAVVAVATAAVLAQVPARAVSPEVPPSVLIVIDGSGSMKRTDASGTTLVDGAKQAVRGLVDSLPDTAFVGLRVYGTQVAGNDKAAGCRDTQLVAPVAKLDKPRLTAAVEDIKAVGFTPIGYSLQQAAKDLPASGERRIVLVSDGEDTCTPPQPCTVAKQLRKSGVDVTIDTIGFRLEGKNAKKQLTCIAKATKGTYRDADSASALGTELQNLGGRSFREAATGQPVEGRPSPVEAPELAPGTLYTDTLLGKEKLFYAVQVQPGQSVRATVTAGAVRGLSVRTARTIWLRYSDATGTRVSSNTILVANTIDFAQPAAGTTTSVPASAQNAGRWVFEVESSPAVDVAAVAAAQQPLQLKVELVGTASVTATPTSATPTATPTTTVQDSTSAGDDGVPGWLVAVLVLLAIAVLGLGGAVLVLVAKRRNAGQS